MPRCRDTEALEALRSLERRRFAPIDPDEIRSLASEAVARGLQSPPPDGRFQPWVHRIFANLVMDRFRRLRTEESARMHWPSDAASDPEQHVSRLEEERALRCALAELPADSSEPLVMHYFQDQDYAEIARGLACARPTVRTRIHRALRKMREKLGNLRAVLLPIGPVLKAAPLAVFVVVAAVAPTVPAGDSELVALVPPERLVPASLDLMMTLAANGETSASPSPNRDRYRRPKRSNRDVPEPASPPVARFDFENDVVTADLKAPDVIMVDADVSAPQSSLIEIPGSFVPALLKSLENL